MFKKKTIICILILFFSITIFCLNFSKEEYSNDLAKETPWNELSNNYRFNVIEFNNNAYSYGESILNNDVLKDLLEEKEIKVYNDEIDECKSNCKIYSLKKINENYIIAIQFDEESNCYLYVNIDYKFNTLKDLIETTDFIDNSNINTISYNYVDDKESKIKSQKLSHKKISKINKDDLYVNVLNKNFDVPIENFEQNIYKDYFNYEVKIDLNLSNLNQNILLEMTDSGYLILNICNIPYCFYIGDEDILNFIDDFFSK